MIRILHVLGGLGLGGAESRIMDMYRNIDREKIQFDFLVHAEDPDNRIEQFYDAEVRSLGGNIYVLPKFKVYNYFSYLTKAKEFFREHHDFKIVQGHMTSTAAIYLPVAKRYGVETTIAHSRNAGVYSGIKGLATKFFRRNITKKADILFACSKEAAADVFGIDAVNNGDVTIIHNAIDAKKFSFDENVRNGVRKELGLDENGQTILLGNVARFTYQKNHKYMIDILKETVSLGIDAKIIFLGEGQLMDEMKEKAKALSIEDRVIFAGNQKNPSRFYQAMDLFLLPSMYEGLPGVLVEAQSAGLKCLVSSTVTKEAVGCDDLVDFLSIEEDPKIWAKRIAGVMNYKRRNTYDEMARAGFDAISQVKLYEKFYLEGDYSGFRQ